MGVTPIVVTVAGGKGGVGKSLVAANLGIALARLGMRTVLVDADLGSPTQHTLFGIERLGPTLAAFVDGRARALGEVTIPSGVPHLDLVPGTGGLPGAANPAHARKQRLARALRSLDTEVVVVDLGAGASHNVVDLFLVGHARLLVTAPQLTSGQSAYCFAKTALVRAIRGACVSPREVEAVERTLEPRALAKVPEGLAVLAIEEPALARRARELVAGFGTSLVGNLVEPPNGASVLHALARMFREFLGASIDVAAVLPRLDAMHRSVDQRRPLMLRPDPDPAIARPLEALAERIAVIDVAARASIGETLDSERPPRDLDERGDPVFARALAVRGRREPRKPIHAPVTVHAERGSVDGTLEDLSTHGALLSASIGVRVGEPIALSLGSGPRVPVVVRHASATRIGVELEGARVASLATLLGLPSRAVALQAEVA